MRAFLAIPLPETVRRAAAAARDALAAGGSGWRFVRDEGLHVTIRFLGEVDASRSDACDTAWRDAASGVGRIELRLRGASCLPSARRPRVLCLGVDDETPDRSLTRLARRVERAARELGFTPEERPHAFHVTLARARGGARIAAPPLARIGELPAFAAEHLVLYRSELGPGGSRYFEEASYPLVSGEGR